MDKLEEFLKNRKSQKILVCIDWANVFRWERIKREKRVKKTKEKIDVKKLYAYLDKKIKTKNKKIFFGLEKSKESVMDNIVRWINKKKRKKIESLDELIKDLKEIEGSEKISSNLKEQIREIYDEHRSTKIIEEFKSIGFDVSIKEVKTFKDSLMDLPKFQYIIRDLQDNIREIQKDLNGYNITDESIEKDKFTKLKEKIEKIRKLCSKKVKNRKCDSDVDIVIEIIRNLDNFDTFVIFSGDGDYASAVKYFLEKEKNIALVSTEKKFGREFNYISPVPFFSKIFADNIEDIWSESL